MDSMLGRNRFGAHGDVMGASPEDEAGKAKLFEEIKSRARYSVKRLVMTLLVYANNLPRGVAKPLRTLPVIDTAPIVI